MNENIRSVIFVVVAVAMLGVAWASQPGQAVDPTADLTGQLFFPDFTDPLSAKEMEIIEFDEATATIHPFEVKEVNGVWSIPSHENYPADANRQLAEAATALIDVKRLNVASNDAGSHEEYGVIEPDPKKLSGGATGVGKKVTLQDAAGKKLAQFIIGKEVKDQPSLRYVRVPGQDRVYTAEMKIDKLSTRFEDWIEKDLLKLNAFDVRKVVVDDHSIDELNGLLKLRDKISLNFDSKDSKWNLDQLQVFNGREYDAEALAADEELNATKLNEMKTALDDLKIVDVLHKPEGLSSDLRADKAFIENKESVTSLRSRGFWLAQVGDEFQLFSNDGEIRCGMNDGVEYILRFGGIAGPAGGAKEEEKGSEAEDADDPAGEDEGGANRYILVTVQFNQDLIPKPELAPVPGEEKAAGPETPAKKSPAKVDDEPPADEDADAAPDATEPNIEGDDEPAPDEATIDEAGAARAAEEPGAAQDKPQATETGEPAADEADGEEPATEEPATEEPAAEEAAAEEAAAEEPAAEEPASEEPASEAPATDEPGTDVPAAEKPAADVPADDSPDADKPKAEKPAAPPKTEAQLKAEREQIKKENKRKQDDYDAKVKKGQERVKELSGRFADWYYIISDKTYQKIHLGRADIIKKKDPPADDKNKPGAQSEPGDELNLDMQKDLPE